MKTAKMKGPSPEELEQTRLQNDALAKQSANLAEQEKKRRADAAAETAGLAANRVGVRSLLSGDWNGFDRGGGLAGR